jgi:hypothetical protein
MTRFRYWVDGDRLLRYDREMAGHNSTAPSGRSAISSNAGARMPASR